MSAFIFDFNGTMILDSVMHDEAWTRFALAHRGRAITHDEFVEGVYGRNIEDALAYLLGYLPEPDEIRAMEDERESCYRALCLEHADELKPLAPGLVELLDALAEKGVPATIATASPRINMEFFFDLLGLDRWFSFEDIVYNDGSFPGKPEPDIFLKAAAKLDIPIEQCTVFEDSPSGLEGARRAGAAHVIALSSEFDPAFLAGLAGIERVIADFRDLDALLALI